MEILQFRNNLRERIFNVLQENKMHKRIMLLTIFGKLFEPHQMMFAGINLQLSAH